MDSSLGQNPFSLKCHEYWMLCLIVSCLYRSFVVCEDHNSPLREGTIQAISSLAVGRMCTFVHAFLRVEGQGKERQTPSQLSIRTWQRDRTGGVQGAADRQRGHDGLNFKAETGREGIHHTEGKRDRNQWRQCIIEQWTYIAFWKKCFKRNIPADTPKHPAHCNPVSFLWSERLSAHFADFTASLNASSSKTKTLLKAAKSLVSPSKHSAGADKATVSIVSHCALELPNIRHNWGECGQKLSIREFI